MSALLYNWLSSVFDDGGRVYLKRLAGNDTKLTGSNQAGPYIPKKVAFDLCPSLSAKPVTKNPRTPIPTIIVSDGLPEATPSMIWYNGKALGGPGKDEVHFTGWGGIDSPVLDPESTGSIAVFSFKGDRGRDVQGCEVWVCSSVEEEDLVEDRFSPIEPGAWLYIRDDAEALRRRRLPYVPDNIPDPTGRYFAIEQDVAQLSFILGRPVDRDCRLSAEQIPGDWLAEFPSGEAIIEKSASMRPDYIRLSPDKRLLKRRDCEYEVFLSVEEAVVLPKVEKGFSSVDSFVSFANSVTNRRKARAGRSLELHAKRIFDEENVPSYSHDQVSEGSKRPDFLFPSVDAYQDHSFPADRLRMLAAKTTCKDRWRQVVDEASRIDVKHLLTLQEGITDNQYSQMERAGVRLVVPKPLHVKYPKSLRGKLLSLYDFIREVKQLDR